MALLDPFIGLLYGWLFGESGYNTGMDANLQRIGALLQIGVKSKSLDVGDITPNEADRYIVPIGGSGAFAGKANQIAYYRGGNWFFIAPKPGFSARVESPPGRWDYTAANTWELQSVPEPGVGFEDAPADGKRYYRKDNGWVEFNDTDSFAAVVDITTTTYELLPTDRGKVLNFTTTCVVTVPVGMPANGIVYLRQASSGAVTVVGDTGVVIDSKFTNALNGSKAIAMLMFLFPDNPTLTGDIV